jgi:hypothetical protein
MEDEINRIIKGNARVEDFDIIEISTCKGGLDLSVELSSILQYSQLKHPRACVDGVFILKTDVASKDWMCCQ